MQDHAPAYLSARCAEIILSEVRPTRIRTEALLSVNVMLDELLWLVVSSAKSFNTDKLKSGLNKVLNTALGKAALLDAEMELRAYWEKVPKLPTPPTSSDFPLQPAFELLRHKCEVHCSLGDVEESPEVEARLKARMLSAAPNSNPNTPLLPPAALYLTAIVEHICEHILSNLARVVARDSSRTTAHLQDLFVALSEDDMIYGLFRTMKVHDQIEQQAKAVKPRRSKSFNRSTDVPRSPSRSNNASPQPPSAFPQEMLSKTRASGESSTGNGSNTVHVHKPSISGAMKIFKSSGKQSGEFDRNGHQGSPAHQRSDSSISESTKRALNAFQEAVGDSADDTSVQDFDDLMRSGSTMKVSLTPDRLKTFEVFAKEKNQRANNKSGLNSPAPLSANLPDIVTFPSAKGSIKQRQRTQVEAIGEEAEEEGGRVSRVRGHSVHESAAPPIRKRTMTDATVPDVLARNAASMESTPKQRKIPSKLDNIGTGPVKRRVARNRESIDLDDLLDDDFEDSLSSKPPMTPKTAQARGSSTRDLIDFLSEGPPEVPEIPDRLKGPPVPEKSKNTGRFRALVGRLTNKVSSERLNTSKPLESPIESFNRHPQYSASTRSVSTLTGRHPRSVTNLADSYQSLANRPQPPAIPLASARSHDSPWSSNVGSGASHSVGSLGINGVSHGMTNGASNGAKPINDVPIIAPTRKASVRKAAPTWLPSPTSHEVDKLQAIPATSSSSSSTSRSSSPVRRPKTAPESPTITTTFEDKTTHVYPPVLSSTGIQTEAADLPKSDPPRPVVAHPDLDQVTELRSLLARATSPMESRLLVDMYFAKWGFPAASEAEESHGSDLPAPALIQDDGSNDDHQNDSFMVEMLLGEGSSVSIIKESDPSVPQTPTNPESPMGDAASSNHKTESPQIVVSSDESS